MVVVTGAAGFIGARVVEALKARGTDVASVDHRAAFDGRPEHAGLDFGQRVDVDDLGGWLKAVTITAIVHLGACTDTREMDRSYLNRVNLEASQELWSHATRAGIPLIYASSAATYGDGALGYDDDEALIARLRPLNPYGQSKQDFDMWVLAQERAGHHPRAWTGLKFFNVYGFGERHKGRMASVVLHAFDQVQSRGFVSLFRSHRDGIADGHQSRDFVFVGDVVETVIAMLDRPPSRGIFNLGSGTARTFLDLTRAVFTALDRPADIRFIDTPVDLRAQYQYFTEARMTRLRDAGFARHPIDLERGVEHYVARLSRAAHV
ncbi:MAG: ADP-glyceromanno-heptose 6-epimerase [Acidobacteriota bacterium]